MAFEKHALVQLVGHWTQTDMVDEVWSIGVRVSTGGPAGYWLAGPQAYATAIAPLISTWYHAATTYMCQEAILDLVKVNNITAAGHYADPITHQATVGNTGGVAQQLTSFDTFCVTLETGRSTGRAKRGRIYPPFAVSKVTTAGVSTSTTLRDAYATAVKGLLAILLRNEPTGGLLVSPVIASRVDASLNAVTGVSANTIIDVQRRRKNRAVGTRSAVIAFP